MRNKQLEQVDQYEDATHSAIEKLLAPMSLLDLSLVLEHISDLIADAAIVVEEDPQAQAVEQPAKKPN